MGAASCGARTGRARRGRGAAGAASAAAPGNRAVLDGSAAAVEGCGAAAAGGGTFACAGGAAGTGWTVRGAAGAGGGGIGAVAAGGCAPGTPRLGTCADAGVIDARARTIAVPTKSFFIEMTPPLLSHAAEAWRKPFLRTEAYFNSPTAICAMLPQSGAAREDSTGLVTFLSIASAPVGLSGR